MALTRAIGLMSGTSMDGIDVALIETDGERKVVRGPSMSFAYEAAFSRRIENSLTSMGSVLSRTERPNGIVELERDITLRHIAAVRSFLQRHEMEPGAIDLIGFHGQTVLHRPERGMTVQLGDGRLLAQETGISTVYDMRANDMRNGGQGAPLVPVYHQALAAELPAADRKAGVAFVNIGGIANVTFVRDKADPVALDCGPGNTLIDQWMSAAGGVPMDAGGAIASEGVANDSAIERYLAHPFFAKSGPKSLDRNDFKLKELGKAELSDGAATLAKLTAVSIIKSAEAVDWTPVHWIIAGGGAHNAAILAHMRQAAGEKTKISIAGDTGFNGDMMEAEAWAYLAVRSRKKLPLTFPTTTGCDKPVTGGKFARATA